MKVLGLTQSDVETTPAYRMHVAEDYQSAAQLFTARVLAFAPATWQHHISSFRDFQAFCSSRELNIFECTPYILNLFMLHQAQKGKSYGCLETFLHSVSFLSKFFMVRDYVQDPMIKDMKRFLQKVCERHYNKKDGFGSAEVRTLWNSIDTTKGGVSELSLLQLRTFVMTVFQHTTFCRFSDLKNIKLSDLLHDIDYFTVKIRYSKTDQAGVGQTVFVPKLATVHRDPHMLMCLYLQRLDEFVEGDREHVYLFPPLI